VNLTLLQVEDVHGTATNLHLMDLHQTNWYEAKNEDDRHAIVLDLTSTLYQLGSYLNAGHSIKE
jgi:hypothetical protein